MCERCQPRTEDPGLVQDLKCVLAPGDVQLVSRRSIEGASPVCPDLGRNGERPEQAEGAPRNRWVGDVEVNRDLAASLQVNATGRMEQP
jgi:hypothetical protein